MKDEKAVLKSENRKLRKALRDLSDSVLLFLYHFDAMAAKHLSDKTVGRDAGRDFAKLATALDMQNDMVRHFSLGLAISTEGKKADVVKLKAKQ